MVEIAQRAASLEELETLVEAEVRGGWTPIEAARVVLSRVWPDGDALRRLVEVGLADVVQGRLGTARSTASRKGIVAVLPHELTNAPGGNDILSIPAESSDGTMKPYLEWAQADWETFERDAEAQADAWARRQDGSREIAKLLEKHQVARTGDLPSAVLDKVRSIVRGFRG